MTTTLRITKIKNPGIRIPLWTAFFTFYLLPDMVISAFLDGQQRRLVAPDLWRLSWSIFLIGVDGTYDN